MNYQELKAAIQDESLRSDLVAQIPLFVRRAEGMIARDMRAQEMLQLLDLAEADRVESGKGRYKLPLDFLEDRSVLNAAGFGLDKTSRPGLAQIPTGASPIAYAVYGDSVNNYIEFRGVPSVDAEIQVEYFARPATLAANTDTNRLLTAHPSIYIDAALFNLYKFTQDLELAQAAYDTWDSARGTLNEQAGRYLAGTSGAPRYNIGRFSAGRGY